MKCFKQVRVSETEWGSHAHEYYYRLPDDVRWYSAQCRTEEVAAFYHRCGKYHAISGGTGRISESARRIALGQSCTDAIQQENRIRKLVSEFCVAEFRPITLGANCLEDGPFNVLEGNCRAVALEILRKRGITPFSTVQLFVAISESERVHVWESDARK